MKKFRPAWGLRSSIFLLWVILLAFKGDSARLMGYSHTHNLDDMTVKRIQFSGIWWKVSNARHQQVGPGNNLWDARNVWIDKNGHLHLKLTQDKTSGKWYCAQVESEKQFGYGSYEFFVEGRVDQLDENLVFGFFNYSGLDYQDEMDIEFAKWGVKDGPNLHYTVWPSTRDYKEWSSNQQLKLNGEYSLHLFKRTVDEVTFQSFHGFKKEQPIFTVVGKEKVSQKRMPVLINLWLFQNQPPADQKEVELVIHKFVFNAD